MRHSVVCFSGSNFVCLYNIKPLFSRLTGVILQEQRFADEFLVTPRARQCIGQACRTALISPLIETLAIRTHSE